MNPSTTVEYIMRFVCQRINIPVAHFRLYFHSKPLNANHTLKELNVTKESTLELIVLACHASYMKACSFSTLEQDLKSIDGKIEEIDRSMDNIQCTVLKRMENCKTFESLNAEYANEQRIIVSAMYEKNRLKSLLDRTLSIGRSYLLSENYKPLKCQIKIEAEIAEIDKEMKKLETKKKYLETDKAQTCWSTDTLKNNIDRLYSTHWSETYDANGKMFEIQKNIKEEYEDAICSIEDAFTEWTSNEVVNWLNIIQNGKFGKYKQMRDSIVKYKIDGKKIRNITDTFLEMVGVNMDDSKLVLKNIHRLMCKLEKQMHNKCCACTENRINTIFLPCGHQTFCSGCISNRKIVKCPICRKTIKKVKQAYMAGF